MRWYLNDLSVRGQFENRAEFEQVMAEVTNARATSPALREQFFVTASFVERLIDRELNVRDALRRLANRDLRSLVLLWITRTGPFVEDDRLNEADDYFECFGQVATDTGLGEATRRIKAGDAATTFSFTGGPPPTFESHPLSVDHGLFEERLGRYNVPNIWTVGSLVASAHDSAPPIRSWRELVERARDRFPKLVIPDSVYQDRRLAAQPFEYVIGDQALNLLSFLNDYMAARNTDGSDSAQGQAIYRNFFQGDRARFSPESDSNRRAFREALTFSDPDDPRRTIEAHWHGKISRNYFRLHFEWPIRPGEIRLKIVYLGPKLTRS